MNIDISGVSLNSKYLTHLKCYSNNCPAKSIVKTFSTSTNNTTLSKKESLALIIRTRGKGGSRPKTSKKVNIYKNILSLDENYITSLLYNIGLEATSCYVAKLARSNLSQTTI